VRRNSKAWYGTSSPEAKQTAKATVEAIEETKMAMNLYF
jgi:hypothetical protein